MLNEQDKTVTSGFEVFIVFVVVLLICGSGIAVEQCFKKHAQIRYDHYLSSVNLTGDNNIEYATTLLVNKTLLSIDDSDNIKCKINSMFCEYPITNNKTSGLFGPRVYWSQSNNREYGYFNFRTTGIKQNTTFSCLSKDSVMSFCDNYDKQTNSCHDIVVKNCKLQVIMVDGEKKIMMSGDRQWN